MPTLAEKVRATLIEHDTWKAVPTENMKYIFCDGCNAVLDRRKPDSPLPARSIEGLADILLSAHQTALIDQLIAKEQPTDARRKVLDSLVTNRTGLDAATAILGDLAPVEKIEEAIGAYLIAPLSDGRFDYEEDDERYLAATAKIEELLDRGFRDADAIASVVLNEIATVARIKETQTHLLRCALREAADASTDRDRFRAALSAAEEDRHPCTALHLRVEELRRRIGEQHGFLLIACSRCGGEMISQEPGNEQANEAMELCSRCTSHLLTSIQG